MPLSCFFSERELNEEASAIGFQDEYEAEPVANAVMPSRAPPRMPQRVSSPPKMPSRGSSIPARRASSPPPQGISQLDH